MDARDQIGPAFPTVCPRHPEQTRLISRPGQLPLYAPAGGCILSCEARLACGHICPSTVCSIRIQCCHRTDRYHSVMPLPTIIVARNARRPATAHLVLEGIPVRGDAQTTAANANFRCIASLSPAVTKQRWFLGKRADLPQLPLVAYYKQPHARRSWGCQVYQTDFQAASGVRARGHHALSSGSSTSLVQGALRGNATVLHECMQSVVLGLSSSHRPAHWTSCWQGLTGTDPSCWSSLRENALLSAQLRSGLLAGSPLQYDMPGPLSSAVHPLEVSQAVFRALRTMHGALHLVVCTSCVPSPMWFGTQEFSISWLVRIVLLT